MTPEVLPTRFAGALLGTMTGDAIGAPVEGTSAALLRTLENETATLPPAQKSLQQAILGLISGASMPTGSQRYTDDTQMTLGVAESLIACSGIDPADMARRFADNFDPRRGYGMAAHRILRDVRRGMAWDEPARQAFGGQGSFGNGAAMRAAPIGLWFAWHPLPDLRAAAEAQARITHTHPLGIEGAVLQAAAVAEAVRADPENFDPLRVAEMLRDLAQDPDGVFRQQMETVSRLLASDNTPEPEIVSEILGSGIEAHRSVPAAIYAFLAHWTSFAESVLFAVRLGDDADTVGAMCGAIAGAFHGAQKIPAHWLDALEDGLFGRTYAMQLAERLFAARLSES